MASPTLPTDRDGAPVQGDKAAWHVARAGLLGCTCDMRIGCEVHGPEPRKNAVVCALCLKQTTWNWNGLCDRCSKAAS